MFKERLGVFPSEIQQTRYSCEISDLPVRCLLLPLLSKLCVSSRMQVLFVIYFYAFSKIVFHSTIKTTVFYLFVPRYFPLDPKPTQNTWSLLLMVTNLILYFSNLFPEDNQTLCLCS